MIEEDMNQDNKITVILPTLNEEENLRLLIPEIVNLLEDELDIEYEVIVVDDGSKKHGQIINICKQFKKKNKNH